MQAESDGLNKRIAHSERAILRRKVASGRCCLLESSRQRVILGFVSRIQVEMAFWPTCYFTGCFWSILDCTKRRFAASKLGQQFLKDFRTI
jgi:hypothetical protein